MTSWSERRALALKHVEGGRRTVERQRSLVERLHLARLNTVQAEELLWRFEHSQSIF
jgi:hypothetical protein